MTAPAIDHAPSPSPPSPTPTSDRITGYDLARALAILGMIVVHFGLVLAPLKEADSGWAVAVMHKLDGRAAATFVILAGVGISLRGRRPGESEEDQLSRRRRARFTLIKRGFFLLAIGFLNLVVWSGDILRVYGVSLLLAAFFLGARSLWLWVMTLAFVLGFVVLLLIFDYEANWKWETLEYKNLWTAAGLMRNLLYDGFRSVFPWAGLLFLGMWLGRFDARRADVRRRLLLWGLAVAVVTEIVSAAAVHFWLKNPGDVSEEDIVALAGTLSMPPLPLFVLAASGTAIAAIALSLMVATRWPGAWIVRALVFTGQMAFTWYVAHIAALAVVLVCGGEGATGLEIGLATGVGFFAICVVTSWLWKKRYRHGPMEWLMRKVAG